MLYFAPSSVPASPIENLTLWNHHESGQAEPFDAQLQEDDLLMNDWPFESKFRQRIANIIVLASRKHRLPISEQEELRKFALGLEEIIFAAFASKIDYLREVASLRRCMRKLAIIISVCEEIVQVVDENSKVQCMQNAKSPLHNLQSGELGNIQEMDKKLKKKGGIVESISFDDLKLHLGKNRKEAAESLDANVSTFKRICREKGIPFPLCPSKKIKRDRFLLSNISSSETVPVADGPRVSISPTAFASTNVLVNSNQQKSWSSNLSVDKVIGTSLNDHVLRNGDEENIMIQEGDSANQEVLYKPQELERACDGTSHLEKQYLGKERLSCNTEKEVIVSMEGSSSYEFRNVSEPNQVDLRKFNLEVAHLMMKTKFQIHVCDETVQVVDENSKVQCMQNAKSPLHNLQSGELGNVQEMDKKLKKKWGIAISLDDLKQHFGKTRKEAAESLDVSVSTFKRICRENGISRWPSKKIKRDKVLLSNISSIETVPVANGPRISISTAPTAFASTNVLVNSNQQKSWSSNLSVDKEIGTSLNDHVLRNGDEENTMIQEGDSANQEVLYKPQELERACDGTSHLEKQYLGKERLSCNTEKEVIVSVEGSSSYDFRNVSEPNQGHLAVFASFCEVDKDQLISTDDLESQSILESIAEPSLQNDARRMKLIFDKLITLPLEDLTNPNHEASMKEALTLLAYNLSLFRDEHAKQLLEFKIDFPNITNCWRDCSQSIIDCRNFLAEFDITKLLLETSTKEEHDLKDKYTQLENKEKEMMAQLEAIRKEKNEITKRRSENFNQTKHLAALAEEQGGRTKDKELQMTIASNKLDNLKRQWVLVQSSFN
ncbi:hypothetical protein H5410_048844 [Solanum commersonii]|uniref:RWP-RK domain-containing protein n=1 Tax=Solanum commersonii TaxID=4109 RepID=A0A9J5XKX1_SOLCO|nr:hypothetical protein H5410_048844 [Solanum commersonii]